MTGAFYKPTDGGFMPSELTRGPWDPNAQHAVALGDVGHPVARRHHGADELVAEREAGLDLHAAVVDVQVRAADSGRLHAHDRVVALEQVGLRPLLEPHLAGSLECDGLHWHGTL